MPASEIDLRVRQNYPALLMMLVSLIVALVFESVITSIGDREALWDGTSETFFFWSQCVVMLVAPLTYGFTLSLHSSSVRRVFSPRDTVASILAAVALNGLATAMDPAHAAPWMGGVGFLTVTAWIGFRDYGRIYEDDPLIRGGAATHRASGRMILASGIFTLTAAALLHSGTIGFFLSGLAMLFASAWVLLAHALWFHEWKAATGVSDHRGGGET